MTSRNSRSSSFLLKYLASENEDLNASTDSAVTVASAEELARVQAELEAATQEIAKVQDQNQILIKQLAIHKLDTAASARDILAPLSVVSAHKTAVPDLSATGALLLRRLHELGLNLGFKSPASLRASASVLTSLISQFSSESSAWMEKCPSKVAVGAIAPLIPALVAQAGLAVSVVQSGEKHELDSMFTSALRAVSTLWTDVSAVLDAVQPTLDLVTLASGMGACARDLVRILVPDTAGSSHTDVTIQIAAFRDASSKWARATSAELHHLLPLHTDIARLGEASAGACAAYKESPTPQVADEIEALVADLRDAVSDLTTASTVSCDSVRDVLVDFKAKIKEWPTTEQGALQKWAYMLDSFAERTFSRASSWASTVSDPDVPAMVALHKTLVEGMLSELSLAVSARIHSPDSPAGSDRAMARATRLLRETLDTLGSQVKTASAGGPLTAAAVLVRSSVESLASAILSRYTVRTTLPDLEAATLALRKLSRMWELHTENQEARPLIATATSLLVSASGLVGSTGNEYVANPTQLHLRALVSALQTLAADLDAFVADLVSAPLLPVEDESEMPARMTTRTRGGLLLEIQTLRDLLADAESTFSAHRDSLVSELNSSIERHNAVLSSEVSVTRALQVSLHAKIQEEADRIAEEKFEASRIEMEEEAAAAASRVMEQASSPAPSTPLLRQRSVEKYASLVRQASETPSELLGVDSVAELMADRLQTELGFAFMESSDDGHEYEYDYSDDGSGEK